MNDLQMYDFVRMIDEEKIRDAERDHLVVEFLAARPARKPFFAPALAWVGNRLVVWGEYLQAHYGRLGGLGSATGPGHRTNADYLASAQQR
jgi:hypothetical protein